MSRIIKDAADASTYTLLALSVKDQLKTIARKLQNRINKYSTLIQSVIEHTSNIRSVLSQDIICNDYIVKSADLNSAINLGADTLQVTLGDGSVIDKRTDEVCREIRSTIDESQIVVAGISSLEYAQDQNFGEVITIFNDKVTSVVRNEENRYSILANSLRDIIIDRSMNIESKLDSLLSYLTVNNNEQLPVNPDLTALECSMSDYTYTSPAAALFGEINIDWSNAWTAIRSSYIKSIQLRANILIGFSKIIYAGYSKVKNWVQNTMTQGVWVSTNDNYEELTFDRGAIKFTHHMPYPRSYGQRIIDQFNSKNGCICRVLVPGGTLYLLKVTYDWEEERCDIDCAFRPKMSGAVLPDGANWSLSTDGGSAALYPGITLTTIAEVRRNVSSENNVRSSTIPFDTANTNIQQYATYTCLLNAFTQFAYFAMMVGYKKNDSSHGFASVTFTDVGVSDDADVSACLNDLLPGYTDNKWTVVNAFNLHGSTAIYASLINGSLNNDSNTLFNDGITELLFEILVDDEPADYGIAYEWVACLPSSAFHLSTNTEMALLFEKALGTIALVTAVVVLSVVAFRVTRTLKKRAAIAQAQADLFYFSDNFAGTDGDWNNWYKLQKKANLLGLLSGAAAQTLSLNQTTLGKISNAAKQYVVNETYSKLEPKFTGLATSTDISTATQNLATANDVSTAVSDLATKQELKAEVDGISALIK